MLAVCPPGSRVCECFPQLSPTFDFRAKLIFSHTQIMRTCYRVGRTRVIPLTVPANKKYLTGVQYLQI